MGKASLLDVALALQPAIAARGAEIEALRRLPPDLACQLAEAGIFRAALPASLGGAELAPADLIDLIAAFAEADGSTGWCVMIGTTASLCAGYLPQPVAQPLFAARDTIVAGIFAPSGVARPVADGLEISGRWQWGSGSQHCRWIFAGCRLQEGEAAPRQIMVALPQAGVQFHDTWHSAGLCGTGSLDFSVERLVVPRAHALSLLDDRPWPAAALYRLPVFGLLAAGIAAVSLGLGRGGLRYFRDLAKSRKPAGSTRALAERPAVQALVADVDAALFMQAAALRQALGECAATPDVAARLRLRQIAMRIVQDMPGQLQRLHVQAGGADAFLASPLQRALRDSLVATQHMMIAPQLGELAGRHLLDLPVEAGMV